MNPYTSLLGFLGVAWLADTYRSRRATSEERVGRLDTRASRLMGAPEPSLSVMSARQTRGSGRAPTSILKKTAWKYIDFLRLYRGISDDAYDEWYTAYENADGTMIEQATSDLKREISEEARKRGVKESQIAAELEERAAAAGLPSATGKARRA